MLVHSKLLDAKEYESVKTGNAKGDYETGNYVLMAEKDDALIAALSADLGLELTYQEDGYDTEDARSKYSSSSACWRIWLFVQQ